MISIKSTADMDSALASPIDAELVWLLTLRRDQLLEHDGHDLGDLVHIVVAEPNDTLATIEGVVGVPLSTNLVDGSCHGEPGFTANFEYVARHGQWFEAVLIFSDDGFGVVLFVPDHPDTDTALLALVRDHS
jgi:hypothetical protein